ncbi:MAG: hypothetical protein E6K10_07150 [Methanobacteriota archaeon]|nr:MAG: hypothetical protein E6K10_07150 [Euryarchaeota archaeon]
MFVKYAWLKELDLLKRRGERMSVRDLRTELDSRGFHVPEKELSDDLLKMRDIGLVESDLLPSADGAAIAAMDDFSSVAITAAGLRKLTAIVKI